MTKCNCIFPAFPWHGVTHQSCNSLKTLTQETPFFRRMKVHHFLYKSACQWCLLSRMVVIFFSFSLIIFWKRSASSLSKYNLPFPLEVNWTHIGLQLINILLLSTNHFCFFVFFCQIGNYSLTSLSSPIKIITLKAFLCNEVVFINVKYHTYIHLHFKSYMQCFSQLNTLKIIAIIYQINIPFQIW